MDLPSNLDSQVLLVMQQVSDTSLSWCIVGFYWTEATSWLKVQKEQSIMAWCLEKGKRDSLLTSWPMFPELSPKDKQTPVIPVGHQHQIVEILPLKSSLVDQ